MDDLQDYLKETNVSFFEKIRLRKSDDTIILSVDRSKVAAKATSDMTSERQLSNLKQKISSKFNTNVEIIFTVNKAHYEMEAGFHQILNHKFGQKIITFFLSFISDNKINVMLELDSIHPEIKKDISDSLQTLFDESGFSINNIFWIDSSPFNLPTNIELLRLIKDYQPISALNIIEKLTAQYEIIDIKWLNRKLDLLRKKGFVIRQSENGTFVLTMEALSLIPAGTRRTSSDITRALAMGKMKW